MVHPSGQVKKIGMTVRLASNRQPVAIIASRADRAAVGRRAAGQGRAATCSAAVCCDHGVGAVELVSVAVDLERF